MNKLPNSFNNQEIITEILVGSSTVEAELHAVPPTLMSSFLTAPVLGDKQGV